MPRTSRISLSAIFIIDNQGIWGEVNKGRLRELSEGNCKNTPMYFSYDFSHWHFSEKNLPIKKIVRKAINCLQVNDAYLKNKLKKIIGASFNSCNYIKGYFEFMVWSKNQIKFFDYNRLQTKTLHKFNVWQAVRTKFPKSKKDNKLYGISASPGMAKGKICIVNDPKNCIFQKGDILVCFKTNIDYISLMQKAGAIITEQGTILSHSAVISREMKKPCLIRVKDATKKLKDGMKVVVNASEGYIIIQKSQSTAC